MVMKMMECVIAGFKSKHSDKHRSCKNDMRRTIAAIYNLYM